MRRKPLGELILHPALFFRRCKDKANLPPLPQWNTYYAVYFPYPCRGFLTPQE